MSRVLALSILAAASFSAGAADWEVKAKVDGITVENRERPGAEVKELRAVAMIHAPPKAVWAVLRDFERYKDTMPYTEESRIIESEEGDKVVHFYSVINPPIVSRRDYAIRFVDESDWRDGKGYLKSTWTLSAKAPPLRDGVVRTPVNEGSWTLEPREDGTKTYATYWLFTHPGGMLPIFIVNKANSSTVPDIFRALRKYAVLAPYKDAR